VVGLDRTWYVLSKMPNAALAAPIDVLVTYRIEVTRLRPKYQSLIQTGAMPSDLAWRQHLHEVWQAIAPGLGLQYDRIETAERGE
jgi:hypothetical protein